MKEMIMETDRLRIRPLQEKDVSGLFVLLSNPRVNCFVNEKVSTVDQAREQIKNALSGYAFAVCLKETDVFIGKLFGWLEKPDTFSPCWNFLQEYCGKGYAAEAVRAWFDYLFKMRGVRRLYAYTEVDNFSSQQLCRRMGMRHEGTFKEFISFVNNSDGTPKYEDTMQFALLRREWNVKK